VPAQGKEPQLTEGLDGQKYWVAPGRPPELIENIGEPRAVGLEPNQALQLSQSAAGQWEQAAAKIFEEPLRRYNDVANKDPTKLTGAEQRTIIVSYAKMIDPTSAVMQNEADAVAKTGEKMPIFNDWWRMVINNSMPAETMASIMQEAEQLANKRYAELASTYGQFQQRLKLYGQDNPVPWIGEMLPAPVPVGWVIDANGRLKRRGESEEEDKDPYNGKDPKELDIEYD